MDLGGSSAIGPRDANEDSFYYLDFSQVDSFVAGVTSFIMVSDGMGGYQGGDIASGIAVSSAQGYLDKLLEMAEGNRVDLNVPEALAEIVQLAHGSIVARVAEQGSANMGATFVGAFLSPTHAWIAHVGDSRAYLIRNGIAQQLTEDHSQVGRMLSQGVITEQEAQNHPFRNRIERALGFSDARPDFNEVDLQQGDALLLCSDGVYTTVDAPGLASCVDGAANAQQAAKRAVKTALANGTDDNSTAVVAFVDAVRSVGSSVPSVQPVPAASQRRTPTIRTSTVVGPRHAAAASQYARERYIGATGRAGVRGGASAAGADVRSARSGMGRIAVPLVVLVAIAAIAWFLLMRPDASESPASVADTSAPSIAGTDAEDATGRPAAPSASSVPETAAPSVGNYSVSVSAELKYVDSADVAQQFGDDPLGVQIALVLEAGSQVSACQEESDYGRGDYGHVYRALDSTYLQALEGDVRHFRQGSLSLDSRLARLFKADDYRQFIKELSSALGDQELSSVVARLVLDSGCLEEVAGQ